LRAADGARVLPGDRAAFHAAITILIVDATELVGTYRR
jgi:hypothetical protein